MIREFKGRKPKYNSDQVFIAESADLIGDVRISNDSSLWYGVVARGDINYIEIGESSNIQDNATLHVDHDRPCIIGKNVTVGHNAIVHGCTVGDNCLIGMGSVVLSGAKIGKNSIIAAGAVVKEGMIIPNNSLVVGVPAKIIKKLDEQAIEKIRDNGQRYKELWKKY